MTPEDTSWLYKNKDHGMMSASFAWYDSLWDLETGFSAIDRLSFSNEDYVKAGALFATGMVSCGVTSEIGCGMAVAMRIAENESPPYQRTSA